MTHTIIYIPCTISPTHNPLQRHKLTSSCGKYDGSLVGSGDKLLVAQLVEALRYKPAGRGFDSR